MAFLNQYSYVVFAGFGAFALALTLWRWQSLPLSRLARVILFALYTALAVLAGAALRYPEEASHAESVEAVEATLGNGRPTFVMLYSNY